MPINTKGLYLALITAFISGVSIFINKFAVDAIQPPLLFTATKNAWVGLMIVAVLLASGKWQQIKKLTKKQVVYLSLIGIIGGSIPFYLFFTGLSHLPAINAALIQKTLVFWVAILALPLLKEKLSKLQFLGVIVLFFSNLVVGGFKGFAFSGWELLILGATIFWAIETILAKKILSEVDVNLVVAARMAFGSIILLLASAIMIPGGLSHSLDLNFNQWFWMMLTATALLFYVMSWYRALKMAPAISVTAILVVSTLITNILSAVFITHTWTALMALQAGIMVIGVLLFYLSATVDRVKYFLSPKS